MFDYRVECVLDIKALLGEAPAWSVEDQSLFWLDLHKNTINRFDPKTGKNKAWDLPSMPGAFALREDNGAVIAAADGFFDIDFGTDEVRKIAEAPFDSAEFRFNDGKPDRQGRLWAGSFPRKFSRTPADKTGALYRFDGVSVEFGFAPIKVSNGIAFSPDGKTMYRAESFERVIYVFDYDCKRGLPSGQRVFGRIPSELGIGDGATVDTEGGYWVALPDGPERGGVGRFTPGGKFDFHIELPVLSPSMVAFGGPDMSTLYVTSVGDDAFFPPPKTKGVHAGDLFAIETPFRGIPETKFPARSR